MKIDFVDFRVCNGRAIFLEHAFQQRMASKTGTGQIGITKKAELAMNNRTALLIEKSGALYSRAKQSPTAMPEIP